MLLWGLTLLRGTLSNGDAVVYLAQALDGDLGQRTVHLGYLLGLSSFLGAWQVLVLPLLTDLWSFLPDLAPPSSLTLQTAQALGMNFFSLGWGLVGAWALMRLELELGGGETPSRVPFTALIWWSFPPILTAVTTGEVEAMMWALCLVSLWGWRVSRPLTAGLALGCALTVTPAALSVLPALWSLAPQSGLRTSPGKWVQKWPHGAAWAQLTLMALVPMAFTLWWGGDDYWRGPRGLLTAPVGMTRGDALELRLGQLPAAWGLWALFLVPGVASAVSGAWPAGRRVCEALLMTTLVTWAVLDPFRDIPAYGISAALLALVVAQGVRTSVGSAPGVSASNPGPPVPEVLDGNVSRAGLWKRGWKWGCLGVGVLQLVLADQTVRWERRQEADFARHALELGSGSKPASPPKRFSEEQLKAWYTTGRPAVWLSPAKGHPEERD